MLVCSLLLASRRLVIASRFQPTAVLLALLHFLAPSRPFVVYSQYKEVRLVTPPLQLGSTATLYFLFLFLRRCKNDQLVVSVMKGGRIDLSTRRSYSSCSFFISSPPVCSRSSSAT